MGQPWRMNRGEWSFSTESFTENFFVKQTVENEPWRMVILHHTWWRMTIRQWLANFLWNWRVVYDVTYDWIMLFFHRRLVYIGRLYHLWQKVIKKSLVPFGHSVIFLDYFFGHSWYNRQYTLVSDERTLHCQLVNRNCGWQQGGQRGYHRNRKCGLTEKNNRTETEVNNRRFRLS